MGAEQHDWLLTASGETITLDPAACQALGVQEPRLAKAELAGVGEWVSAIEGEQRLGDWLYGLLQGRQQARLARVSAGDRQQLQAFARGDELRIRPRIVGGGIRAVRHELNNLLNNIQVNAELAKVLSTQGGDPSIHEAVTRIVDECDRCAEFVRSSLLDDVGDPQIDSEVFLTRLQASRSDSAALLRCSARLPAGLLAQVHVCIEALLVDLGAGPGYQCASLPDTEPAGIQLQMRLPDEQADPLEKLARRWRDAHAGPGSLLGLPAAVRCFSLELSGSTLALQLCAR